MPEEHSLADIYEPLNHPEVKEIPTNEVLYIGELYIKSPTATKEICIFLKNKILICSSIDISCGSYIIDNDSLTITLSFELKFENIYGSENKHTSDIIGFRLIKKNCNDLEIYYTEKADDKMRVLKVLKTLLVQRGFHELFKPIKKLGSGSFATVFEVRRYEDNKKFAVKAFSKNHLFSTPKGKESLINELNVLRMFAHKNVIKMEAVFESDNSVYLLMQLINGNHFLQSLAKVENHVLTSSQIQGFMKRLLEGLQHIHSQRIMHRDLKPENVMLKHGKFEEPVIVDFGLGTLCDVEEYLFYRCGTPGYIAPQIISLRDNKKHVEPVCDIFSAGAIFHILLTGRTLFEGSQFDQVYEKNKRLQFAINPQEIEARCHNKNAADLLLRMLEKNPQNRITAQQALKHPFFNSQGSCTRASSLIEQRPYEKFLAARVIKF